ncbi:MAG TPA: class I SAM-dependent methyltransferase [Mycobacteriales bacterium]|nr:class I SAM-dependent methyltransferase [Mycobacteriales bacterium]
MAVNEPVSRRDAGREESVHAARAWWDGYAAEYQVEHADFLGDADFVWGPEGLREREAKLLGDVAGRDVLEVGCGAAQCSRWLFGQGARAVAFDLSRGQLAEARRMARSTGLDVPLVQADAGRLPFRDASFDLACSAYGAVPFVADSASVMAEVARVLRPGGRWVFSTTHPFRWCFRDDPGPDGLVVESSYFDRRAYVEQDGRGRATYVEHHRTVGDRVREIVGAGLVVEDVVEPEWPDGHEQAWEQWSPLRGRLMPGTVIFVTSKR